MDLNALAIYRLREKQGSQTFCLWGHLGPANRCWARPTLLVVPFHVRYEVLGAGFGRSLLPVHSALFIHGVGIHDRACPFVCHREARSVVGMDVAHKGDLGPPSFLIDRSTRNYIVGLGLIEHRNEFDLFLSKKCCQIVLKAPVEAM